MKYIKGPDFPTAGIIQGVKGIEDTYRTGRGSITVRAKTEIEDMDRGKHRIVVTEIPYQVNKARLIESIADLQRQKVLDGITALRDESDRSGMRIAIELRADVSPDIMLNNLFKHTQMQVNFGAIMLALVDGHPRILNLKQILYYYLKHQEEVITRRSQYELDKARAKAHILEGLLIALDHIDEVIKTIRESRTDDVAKQALMSKFGLSEKQAIAILDMRLRKLTGLERDKLEQDYKDVQETIAYLEDLLSSREKIMGVVKDELQDEKKNFGDERRTQISATKEDFTLTDLIPDEPELHQAHGLCGYSCPEEGRPRWLRHEDEGRRLCLEDPEYLHAQPHPLLHKQGQGLHEDGRGIPEIHENRTRQCAHQFHSESGP